MSIGAITGLLKVVAPAAIGKVMKVIKGSENGGKGLIRSKTAKAAAGGLVMKVAGAALLPVEPFIIYAVIGALLVDFAATIWIRLRTTGPV